METSVSVPTGHVYRVERKRGPAWYAKYRLPDGRQVQKKLGPAWTERGRPPAGYFTKRQAEAWLREVLDQARRGTLPGLVRTGATFADAAAEYLRYVEQDRGRKPSTVRRAHATSCSSSSVGFWAGRRRSTASRATRPARSRSSSNERAATLRCSRRRRCGRWFARASYYLGQLTTPKSGKVRAVPLAPAVASALAPLSQREHWTSDGDLVFAGIVGSYLDGSALRRRYKVALSVAGLRALRFHDLRHTFGTRMIAKADIRRVQEWMGHADVPTTMRYLHYAPREEDARLRQGHRPRPRDRTSALCSSSASDCSLARASEPANALGSQRGS